MKATKALIMLLVAICAISLVSASEIKDAIYDIEVREGFVHVSNSVIFTDGSTGYYEAIIPPDARNVKLYVDNNELPYARLIPLNETRNLIIEYDTNQFLADMDLIMNIQQELNVSNLFVKVKLKEGIVLRKAIDESEVSGGSVYPKPTVVTSDGQTIILIWKRSDFKAGEVLSLLLKLKEKSAFNIVDIVGYLILISILVIYFVGHASRQRKADKSEGKKKGMAKSGRKLFKKQGGKQESEKHKEEEGVHKHLKEEEQQIIRILKDRGGSCEQGTLRIVGDFSKAKLSRLLSELEERKVIHKEEKGKKNIIYLK